MKSAITLQQEIFLSRFDDRARVAIIEYGKRITEVSNKCDLIMFMARKAVCFAESLRILRLASFQCESTSNRILDMNPSWIAGRHVALFDDALISGTTLFKTKDYLERIGCSVDIYVLCINKDWYSKDLVRPIPPYLELSDNECASICADIVNAISTVPMPYATDYPFFSSLRITDSQFESLIASPYWNVSDVRTNIQSQLGIINNTFEPTMESRNLLSAICGNDLRTKHLVKVRFYARHFHGKEDYLWCNILPIVAFDPLTKKQVDDAFQSISSHFDKKSHSFQAWFNDPNTGYHSTDISYKAKLRLLQYLSAHSLATYWIDSINNCGYEAVDFKQSHQILKYLFPEPLIPLINELTISKVVPEFKCQENAKGDRQISLAFTSPDLKKNAWSVENRLSNMFVSLFETFELPSRRLVLQHGENVFSMKQYEKIISRLERGYSLSDLRDAINSSSWPANQIYSIVSRFLDRMVDRGIVVPTTCVINDTVFRGFRHGEDVMFAEDEKNMFHIMLKAYSDEIYDDVSNETQHDRVLTGIEIEKLCVITLKKLLDMKYLKRPDKNILGQNGTIGVRFALHGAVVCEDSPKLHSTSDDTSIRQILTEWDVLVRKSGDAADKYIVKPLIEDFRLNSSIPKGAREEADSIGYLFGYLRGRSRKKVLDRLTKNDLTLLATISDPKDVCGALCAEIVYVKRGYSRFRSRFIKAINDKTVAQQTIQFLRDYDDNYMFVALHSAHWKYQSWLSGKVKEIIHNVHKGLLDSKNRMEANKLMQYWSFDRDSGAESVPPSLLDVINRLALWHYSVRFHYTALELALRALVNDVDIVETKAVDELKTCYSEISKLNADLGMYSYAFDSKVIDANMAINSIDMLIHETDDLIDAVDVIATPYGEKQELLDYGNSLIVLYSAPSSSEVKIADWLTRLAAGRIREYNSIHHFSGNAIRIVPGEVHGLPNAIVMVGYRIGEIEFYLDYMEALLNTEEPYSLSFIMFPRLNKNSHLYTNALTNEYFGNLFWKRIQHSIKVIIERPHQGLPFNKELNILLEEQEDMSLLPPKISSQLKRIYQTNGMQAIIKFEHYLSLPFKNIFYEPSWSYRMKNDEMAVDIGIIAVVSDEYRAVVKRLQKYPSFKDNVSSKEDVRHFCLGSLPSRDSKYHSVACIRALKQGNTSIMPAYQQLRNQYNPKLMILLGMGGRIDEDVNICDVFVSNAVLDYDARAETPIGIQRTYNPLPILEPWIQNQLNKLEEKYGETLIFDAAHGSINKKFKVLFGPIGSGSAVVKDEEAELREWLLSVSRKTKGVETEAVGFVEQYHNDKLRHFNRTKGYLIVRGVADKADVTKDKKYRYISTLNAMIFIEKLLAIASAGFTEEIPLQ